MPDQRLLPCLGDRRADPVPVTFGPTISGCTPAGWSIEGGNYAFYVHDVDPVTVLEPSRNRDTAPRDVTVSVYSSGQQESTATFPRSFVVKRATVWDQFNASPEPARKGSKITIEGRLRRADWEEVFYIGTPHAASPSSSTRRPAPTDGSAPLPPGQAGTSKPR